MVPGWGVDTYFLETPFYNKVVNLGPVIIGQDHMAIIVMTVILVTVLYLFFRFTKLGVAMQATQQDPVAARINGVPTNRVVGLTFGMSSVIGAVAALLTAPLITLDTTLMWDPLLKGFAAAVLGGLNAPVGAVLGGYLLGVVENLFGSYISVEFKSSVAFLIIVFVLWFRPSGLLAHHYKRKV